jgi:hypothetical protein
MNAIDSMDLSWNYAAESQAYDRSDLIHFCISELTGKKCRCHRIGQEKDEFVKRLVVENTIEERCVDGNPAHDLLRWLTLEIWNSMLRLQEVKMGLSDAALGEGTGVKLNKLSVKDIRYVSDMHAWIDLLAESFYQLFGMTTSKPAKNDGKTQARPPAGSG